ncbi:MAG: hypothetical protein V4492_06385, partial [Chlamydiota bacterium]
VVRLPTMTKRVSGITETDAPGDPQPGIRPCFYTNRTVREYMDIQTIRDKNVLISMQNSLLKVSRNNSNDAFLSDAS